MKRRDLEQAIASYEQCVAARRALAEADESDVGASRDLASAYYYLGHAQMEDEDFAAAGESARQGAHVLRRLEAAGVGGTDVRDELAFFEAAARTSEQAVADLGTWDEVLTLPEERLPELLEMRAVQRVRGGDIAAATQAATKLLELPDVSDAQLYNAACVLSLAAASLAPSDGEELTAEESEQRQAWINASLEALQRSIKAGWSDFELMEIDSDLDALRDLEEFKKLLPNTESPSPSEPGSGDDAEGEGDLDKETQENTDNETSSIDQR